MSDDSPAGAGRIDWALNGAGKRTTGLMRIPIMGTACPRGSLPDLAGTCQAWTLAGRFRLQCRMPIPMPVSQMDRPILEVVPYGARTRLMRGCERLQKLSIRWQAPGPVRSFQQVGSARTGPFPRLPCWSLDVAIRIHRWGRPGEYVATCDASASRSQDPRRYLARKPFSNSAETAGQCTAWRCRNGGTSDPKPPRLRDDHRCSRGPQPQFPTIGDSGRGKRPVSCRDSLRRHAIACSPWEECASSSGVRTQYLSRGIARIVCPCPYLCCEPRT